MPSPMRSDDRIFYRACLLTSLAIFSSEPGHAADPGVDAGSLLQQNERELNQRKPTEPAIRPEAAKPSTKASINEPTVQVSGFKFEGNTLLSAEVLNRALSEFVNQPLTLSQL